MAKASEIVPGETRFDRLLVVRELWRRFDRHGKLVVTYLVLCDCGRQDTVQGRSLKAGRPHRCRQCWLDDTAETRRRWSFPVGRAVLTQRGGGA